MTKTMTTVALGTLLAFLPVNARAQGNNDGLFARVQALETLTATLQNQVQALTNLLSHFSRSGNEIFVTGANLHVVNGAGTTNSTTGFGNIIIGYNEARLDTNTTNVRTGSHMLVVGSELNYSQFGGIVAGFRNSTGGPYSSVTGGFFNFAGGPYSSVTGGEANFASGQYSSVTGGSSSGASGQWSSVTGGAGNSALGSYSSVTGGQLNRANGQFSSVTGGQSNTASEDFQNLP